MWSATMKINLVGVFDDAQVAASAVQHLRQSGIDAGDIRTHSNASTDSGRQTHSREHHSEFSRMFERDQHGDLSGHLAEATRRGGCVVTVQLKDKARADEVERILKTEGAVDFDDRVRTWQSSGYTGYDAGADDLPTGQIGDASPRASQSGSFNRSGTTHYTQPGQGR
jgi:hypothetical protein